jgi:8-oxo-dGTP pyrophosphatase MutT (NUDIX family)
VTGAPELPAGWLARLHARTSRPPRRPRLPLRWRGITIGSVDPGLPGALAEGAPGAPMPWHARPDAIELHEGELTPTLALLADGLRQAGLVHAWRDEQLAVRDPQGAVLGSVERGVVRPLGIATHAVHLVGCAPDGRHWVQLRSLTKANDPGLWDTLMGGMVPACDSLQDALARETWEEAGLRLPQLHGLRHGGQVATCGPSSETGWGYVVESIDWYRCVVPEAIAPANQDGEVDRFELLEPAQLHARLVADAFTTEAALVYAAAGLANGC